MSSTRDTCCEQKYIYLFTLCITTLGWNKVLWLVKLVMWFKSSNQSPLFQRRIVLVKFAYDIGWLLIDLLTCVGAVRRGNDTCRHLSRQVNRAEAFCTGWSRPRRCREKSENKKGSSVSLVQCDQIIPIIKGRTIFPKVAIAAFLKVMFFKIL